jgi:cytochrome c
VFRGLLTIAGLALVIHLVVLLVSAEAVQVSGPLEPLRVQGDVGDRARGAQLIQAYGCGACHYVPGIREARAKVGPPLTDFAERAYIAGNLPNTPANLSRWIRNPQAVEPGTAMPNLGVSSEEAADIVAYLYAPQREARWLSFWR